MEEGLTETGAGKLMRVVGMRKMWRWRRTRRKNEWEQGTEDACECGRARVCARDGWLEGWSEGARKGVNERREGRVGGREGVSEGGMEGGRERA